MPPSPSAVNKVTRQSGGHEMWFWNVFQFMIYNYTDTQSNIMRQRVPGSGPWCTVMGIHHAIWLLRANVRNKTKCNHVFKFRLALDCHFDRAQNSCTNVRTAGPRVSGIYVNISEVTSIIAHSNNCDSIRSLLSCSIANVKTPISRKSTEPPNRLIFCCARVEKISPPEVDNV